MIYWIVALLYYRILRIGGHGDSQPKLRISYYAGKKVSMKLVKVSIELAITDDVFTPRFDNEKIADYLNNKLYNEPEFFGGFEPENIIEVREFE